MGSFGKVAETGHFGILTQMNCFDVFTRTGRLRILTKIIITIMSIFLEHLSM